MNFAVGVSYAYSLVSNLCALEMPALCSAKGWLLLFELRLALVVTGLVMNRCLVGWNLWRKNLPYALRSVCLVG